MQIMDENRLMTPPHGQSHPPPSRLATPQPSFTAPDSPRLWHSQAATTPLSSTRRHCSDGESATSTRGAQDPGTTPALVLLAWPPPPIAENTTRIAPPASGFPPQSRECLHAPARINISAAPPIDATVYGPSIPPPIYQAHLDWSFMPPFLTDSQKASQLARLSKTVSTGSENDSREGFVRPDQRTSSSETMPSAIHRLG